MYFLSINVLIRQLLPPYWRTAPDGTDSGKSDYLKAILNPFKQVLNGFDTFRIQTSSEVNLSAQVMTLENHIEKIAGLRYGVYISEQEKPNYFLVNIPVSGRMKLKEINQFLKKIVPVGRYYELIFY